MKFLNSLLCFVLVVEPQDHCDDYHRQYHYRLIWLPKETCDCSARNENDKNRILKLSQKHPNPAEGVNSQLVETVDFETTLNFLFGQSLLSRLKGRVDIRRKDRPVVLFAVYGSFLYRALESASSMVILILTRFYSQ